MDRLFIEAVYARASLEQGENGTPHFQAAVGYANARQHKAMRKAFPGCHIEISKNAMAAWRYCGKTETRLEGPIDKGVPPASRAVKGDTKERNQMILEYGSIKAIDEGLVPIEKLK